MPVGTRTWSVHTANTAHWTYRLIRLENCPMGNTALMCALFQRMVKPTSPHPLLTGPSAIAMIEQTGKPILTPKLRGMVLCNA